MAEVQLARTSRVYSTAMDLFPTDARMRSVHYCREATMDSRSNPHYSPRAITPFLIGHPGYGKTSQFRSYARALKIGYEERKLAGVLDIAEVFGMYKPMDIIKEYRTNSGEIIEKVKHRMVHYAPEWWPDEDSNPEGIIVWDDANRCLPHIANATMQVMIDLVYNDLVTPEGWTHAATGNPEDGNNDVLAFDDAQNSRMLMIGYTRPNSLFYDQTEKQDIHNDLKNVWMKDASQCDPPELKLILPKNNDRTKMIFGRVYPYLLHDADALTLCANSMFGTGWLAILHSMQEDNRPFEPMEILDGFEENKEKLVQAKNMMRNDILSLTATRLITYVMASRCAQFTDAQLTNFTEFCTLIPDGDATMVFTRLFSEHQDMVAFSGRVMTLDTSRNAKALMVKMKSLKQKSRDLGLSA